MQIFSSRIDEYQTLSEAKINVVLTEVKKMISSTSSNILLKFLSLVLDTSG